MIRKRTLIMIVLAIMLALTGCDKKSSESTSQPEVIDGHLLPSDPGEAGEEALLGIDSNNDGVRDDVERYIYHRFSQEEYPRTKIAIAMQYGRAVQKILVDSEHAYEKGTYREMEMAHDCQWYFYDKHLGETYVEGLEFRKQNPIFDKEFEDIVFNTKERLEAYFTFNASLSGNVFTDRKQTLDKCETNIDDLGE